MRTSITPHDFVRPANTPSSGGSRAVDWWISKFQCEKGVRPDWRAGVSDGVASCYFVTKNEPLSATLNMGRR
ncbi:hypothetical protein CA85_23900 [Allorhodopirellula solitaria]|uniref:Uncharacterized protein n=1 Tax=Allorhodopirellula solitaria TaxID=2527987 RepID=A0A5C5XY93_9BACT|nr:hypothetical protein CA85_23900 [Allorhodopirellula solitaria]